MTPANSGVVVVTVNYRLGFEGFGHLPGVPEAHARAGGRTWLYDLTWPAPAVGAGHGVDVPSRGYSAHGHGYPLGDLCRLWRPDPPR